MRFSKFFKLFADWLWLIARKRTTRYQQRIVNYMTKHPGATLAEARGHRRKVLPSPPLFRPPVPKEKEVPPIYRVSYGLKGVPIHHKYYGFLLQAWSDDADYLTELDKKLEDLFVRLCEKWIGYKESDWWWVGQIGYERPQEMFLKNPSLINTWEWRVEKKGMILDLENGSLSHV